LAVFALLFACTLAARWSPGQMEFALFMRQFNKTYSSQEEFNSRFMIFSENLKTAAQHQAANPKARFGVTQFMDLSPAEFSKMYLNAGNVKNYVAAAAKTEFPISGVSAPNPTSFDWGSAGAITPVYNQGQCGSCWAFSATETIESYWFLAGHGLTQLSMEQIVDCDTTCYGCGGGWPYLAYQYVQQQGGIDSYNSYPYTAGGGQSGSCAFSASNVVAQVTGYQSISGETGIYQQLSTAGPVSVCVDASSWQFYTSGILTSCGTQVDHCVQATGYYNYGSSSQYWNVRNSWGTSWGINGYIWIAIGQDLCDIGDYATIVNV